MYERGKKGRSPLSTLTPVFVLHLIQLHCPDPPVGVPVLRTQSLSNRVQDVKPRKLQGTLNLNTGAGATNVHGATSPISVALLDTVTVWVAMPPL